MRTLEEAASAGEQAQCATNVEILRDFYGISLAVKSATSDELWTTTRIAEMYEAARMISRTMRSKGVRVSFRQAFGNTTMTAGADVDEGCASTEEGISSNNIDWGSCVNDDPFLVINIVHELGHVLKFRNDSYASVKSDSSIVTNGNYLRPTETWDRMLSLTVGTDYSTNIFRDIDAGFLGGKRQNRGEGGRSHDEEVSDMFLYWAVPELEFSQDRAGELRQAFVNGFAESNYNNSKYPLVSLGMKTWVERAAGMTSGQFLDSSVPSTIRVLFTFPSLDGQCLNLPFLSQEYQI